MRAQMLIVGESATVKGEVIAEEVIVHGRVVGRLRGLKVRLSASARCEGDIVHKTIAIESGAHFEGSVQRQDDPLGKAAKAEARPARAGDGRRIGLQRQGPRPPAGPWQGHLRTRRRRRLPVDRLGLGLRVCGLRIHLDLFVDKSIAAGAIDAPARQARTDTSHGDAEPSPSALAAPGDRIARRATGAALRAIRGI